MNWEERLNEKQLDAVTCPFQHVRVVAGAGSGKTRVLTYRIAYLIDEFKVKPWNILAFTFTNKVAGEMKERIVSLIPDVSKFLTIRTFHSFGAFFLRQEISALNFPTNFTILDEEDQVKLIKDIAVELGYKKSDEIIKVAINYIGNCKLNGKYPDDMNPKASNVPYEKDCLEIYRLYEEQKNRMYCLDFDDLLLYTNYILENYPAVKTKWQNRIDHILIDEFQDTNDIEFKLICLLKKPMASLYVVGDPDQTIYTWRGANQEIILKLEKHFSNIETIVLDQNYRSTQTILDSANKLISHNKLRVKKDLFTNNAGGDPIAVKGFGSSKEEANYVASEISRLIASKKYVLRDIVLLYRSNYLTVDFEHALMTHHIPYKIYGGQKFYQRREIKDVLAYFNLIVNPSSNISFERIINVPRRGIGDTSLLKLKQAAEESKLSLYDYVSTIDLEKSPIKKTLINSLKTMIARIEVAKDDISKNEEIFSKVLEDMIVDLNYYDYLMQDEDNEDRIQNVKALFQDLRHYLKQNPEASFDQYLQDIALLSAQDEIIDGDYVTLMTVHTAKGLEYPVVFVVRFNDNVFPNARSLSDTGFLGIEEERRLAYVAFTRAKEKLYITYCYDYSYVVQSHLTPSFFLKEAGLNANTNENKVPFFNRQNTFQSKYFKDDGFDYEINDNFNTDKPKTLKEEIDFNQEINNDIQWSIGDRLHHKNLGDGTVIAVDGDGIITVKFDEHGEKDLMGNHKFLSKI